jgi:hypothetical protein
MVNEINAKVEKMHFPSDGQFNLLVARVDRLEN